MRISAMAFVAALAMVLAPVGDTLGSITIGSGPWIGTDTAGNSYNEEFQDWTHDDCRALDGAGSSVGGRYNFGDGYDDSRDLIAFYSREEGSNYYFRVDLYDLALNAENGSLDIYVAIDCATGGQTWMPDYTDVQVSHPWEICIKLYDTVNYDVINSGWTSVGGFLGAYYHSQIDAVEFGITRQTLINAGWDGSSVMYFTIMTTRDFVDPLGAPGDITGGYGSTSDATDTFYDDDRGYSDGIIDGAIPSNATVGRAKYASIAHGNQSINQADDLRVHLYDPTTTNKTGFIRTLDTHEIFNVPINIHMSGSLMVAARWAEAPPGDDPNTDGPAFLQRVGEFVDLDQNDGQPGALIGGVLAEHIMPYFEGDVSAASIAQFNELMLHYFGLAPEDVKVMHTPERVIRSLPTGLSPLDGYTFADIDASPYAATYLDEVTHLHWWFYSGDSWSGYNGSFDAPRHHKVHLINGVYCFMINDREDQAKFGPHDGGMAMDTRFTLVDKAQQTDQAQLTLIFDDWEALAGKSFDPVSGQSVENNNQWQYQQTIRWAANHPWIEIVTLAEVLDRATDPGHPQYDAAWVVNQGPHADLSMQNYEWLKHASEDTYHYWYYNQDGPYAGNEQNFYDLVPVITGEQGDYHRRFPGSEPTNDAQADALDGPKLPSGKSLGDLNTPNTLLHDAWSAITAAPAGQLKTLAEYAYSAMIYETAWHEEDDGSTGSYQGTNYGNPWPHTDTTWDGVNTWALRLQNHARDLGVVADAAAWADDVRNGTQPLATQVRTVDLDQDGENEYVLANRRLYACFEQYGGRCEAAFAFVDSLDDAVALIGAPVSNPSEPGEEENVGTAANRCSAFKDMTTTHVDQVYNVTAGADSFTFTSQDGQVSKTIRLPAAAGVLTADYTNTTGSDLYVRVGASPNNLDLMMDGRDNLTTALTGDAYTVTNSSGGQVRVYFGSATHNSTPSDAGYQNRNLALTEQVEVYGGGTFSFAVQLNTSLLDADEDGDLDLTDYAAFADCLNGPNQPPAPACTMPLDAVDVDADGDVDLDDYAAVQGLFTGNLTP